MITMKEMKFQWRTYAERASILAVFCASVYFDIWSKIQTRANILLLSIMFVLTFILADKSWVEYEKIIIEEKKEDGI